MLIKKSNENSYQGIKYTLWIILIVISLILILIIFEKLSFINKLIDDSLINYLLFEIRLSILYSSLEEFSEFLI